MNDPHPVSLLLGALGGQGGGVLTNWLVEAARLAGFPAQSTSIPGVAQRTGATTYYFEIFPFRNPASDPIFCLFPSAGDVDMVAALEPTEAGRALEGGYVTNQTTVITTTERVYSTAEKSIAGDGSLSTVPILEAIEKTARRLVRVDVSGSGKQANARMLGAIIQSGLLPLTAQDARQAIASVGLAVEMNLAGFESGFDYQSRENGSNGSDSPVPVPNYDAAPPGFESEMNEFPESLRWIVGHALARLVDYQNEKYAQNYLARLKPVFAMDKKIGLERNLVLTQKVAQRLAAWMSQEDIFRVAQLKTKKGRFARIREEVDAKADEPVKVVDFFSPGQVELSSALPLFLSRLFSKRIGIKSRSNFALHLSWPTSSPLGYAGLKFLSLLRVIRQLSAGFHKEQQAIQTWLEAVQVAAGVDYSLGCATAELAIWARGYGDVRERGLACLDELFTDWARRLRDNPEAVSEQVRASLHAARYDPDNQCV